MKNFLPLLFLSFLLSCKENAGTSDYAITEDVAESKVMMAQMSPAYANDADGVNDAMPEKSFEQKIIKNATLKFETSDLEKTRSQILKAIAENKASIQRETEGKDGYSIYKKISIRVPSQNFEKILASIGNGVSYFDEKEIYSEDITSEYIDTEARIKTKKILETRYLELLKKASKVSEILEIEKELSTIREEIESKEGQLKYMQNQVSMSSVYVEFYKLSPSESGVTKSFGSKMGNALEQGFLGLSSFFLWLLEVWPFIIILVVLFLLIKRRFKRKKA